MKRRILSIVTALALCLSLCPTRAFAVEGEIIPDDGELVTDVQASRGWQPAHRRHRCLQIF